MAMNEAYLNMIANHARTQITHIGLVDAGGTEVATRQAVTFQTANNGRINISADLTFDVSAGSTVAGWRAFSASTDGTNYGGAALTAETFAGDGTYTLKAGGQTYIDHNAA